MLNMYFAYVFTVVTDVEDRKINVGYVNMPGQFEIKKKVELRHPS